MPDSSELRRFNADLFSDTYEVRLMRFEESDQRGEERRVVRPAPKLVCPDSGQLEEPAGPAVVSERCSQCCKRKCLRIGWRLHGHRLDT